MIMDMCDCMFKSFNLLSGVSEAMDKCVEVYED